MKLFNILSNVKFCGQYSYLQVISTPQNIKDPDDIVTRRRRIQITFDYPLSEPAIFTFTTRSKKGWTRRALFLAIQKGYYTIYKSHNKYGVWGHSIGDLIIEGVRQNKMGDRFTLIIGS